MGLPVLQCCISAAYLPGSVLLCHCALQLAPPQLTGHSRVSCVAGAHQVIDWITCKDSVA